MTKATLLTLAFFTAAAAGIQAAPKNSPTERFYGKVTSVSAADRTFSVHNKKNKADATFSWTEDTKFMSNKKPIAGSELTLGQMLIISYAKNGEQMEAKRVTVRPPSNRSKN